MMGARAALATAPSRLVARKGLYHLSTLFVCLSMPPSIFFGMLCVHECSKWAGIVSGKWENVRVCVMFRECVCVCREYRYSMPVPEL